MEKLFVIKLYIKSREDGRLSERYHSPGTMFVNPLRAKKFDTEEQARRRLPFIRRDFEPDRAAGKKMELIKLEIIEYEKG